MIVVEKEANMTVQYVEYKKMVLVLNMHVYAIEEIQEYVSINC